LATIRELEAKNSVLVSGASAEATIDVASPVNVPLMVPR